MKIVEYVAVKAVETNALLSLKLHVLNNLLKFCSLEVTLSHPRSLCKTCLLSFTAPSLQFIRGDLCAAKALGECKSYSSLAMS